MSTTTEATRLAEYAELQALLGRLLCRLAALTINAAPMDEARLLGEVVEHLGLALQRLRSASFRVVEEEQANV